MCHNSPDTTERLRQALAPVVDTIVVDSGSDEGCKAKITEEVIYCDNMYWTGCWNYAIELMSQRGSDVLWVIGGDVELRSKPEEYVKAMKASWPFGCWHPVVDGVSRPLMQAKRNPVHPTQVWHLEGIAMAVSREAIKVFKALPRDNKYGWGLDIWMNWKSWTSNQRNILDGGVKIFHPDLRGYSSYSAHMEMLQWFENNIGKNYRDELHYWSDSADYNRICAAGKYGCTVVVSSYNQGAELVLALASLANQETLPIEVIVSDDGSTDGTLEWLDSLSEDAYPFRLSYLTREHNGYNLTSAYNSAFQISQGKRIIFTNSDIIHNAKSVKAHMKLPDDKMGMGYTGIIPLPKSKAVTVEHVFNESSLADMVEDGMYICNPRIQGGNFSVPADIFKRVGGFRDSDGYGSEVADFLERAAAENGCEPAKASLGGDTMLTCSCGFHLGHPTKTYKSRQLGTKQYQKEHLGVEA
jgi:hypothetical protein